MCMRNKRRLLPRPLLLLLLLLLRLGDRNRRTRSKRLHRDVELCKDGLQ
jgi:hypothetical protein